ncbi:RNA 2',3'-cyclic phosphodiesterase [Halobacillus shinanisalinarum]|uniref:RNA 2',3'-cyclic phosphodiesterase n=1 Tax=Halobacillus shinanisalinarum TaxID=2932258 RepID=A0ABY4H164_9BACI|nr:RNA 2',3'-cyclic phosphodiesterase [Halobacillus shinanisalinarum]UOQ94181.1 RNA 2',3'-cyclic phosphodiesterase [Halobacillus shinanisalinarum]
MTTNHYFIGVPLQKERQDEFADLQEILREEMKYKNWTHPEDFHITLKFLGACTTEQLEAIKKELLKKSWPDPFELQLGPADAFGKKDQPRVFHVSVEAASPLVSIKRDIEQLCEQVGFERENRTYKPHVTLAKKWISGISPLSAKKVHDHFLKCYSMEVDRFCLYQIHPQQSPKYEVVCEVNLDNGGET